MVVGRVQNGSPIPTDAEVERLGYWWLRYKNQPLEELPKETNLAVALADVGVMALGYLARRLTDPDTPPGVRDRIALALGPKVLVQLHRGVTNVPASDEGEGLLADYKPEGA